MNKKLFLFDLDGTLSDSSEGITKAVSYALESFGIEVPDRKELSCFIGRHCRNLFRNFMASVKKKRHAPQKFTVPIIT